MDNTITAAIRQAKKKHKAVIAAVKKFGKLHTDQSYNSKKILFVGVIQPGGQFSTLPSDSNDVEIALKLPSHITLTGRIFKNLDVPTAIADSVSSAAETSGSTARLTQYSTNLGILTVAMSTEELAMRSKGDNSRKIPHDDPLLVAIDKAMMDADRAQRLRLKHLNR